MRTLFALISLSLIAAAQAESLQDKPFEWENEAQVNTLGHEGYLKLFVYYCADCPRAGGMMKNDVKSLHDYIEKEKLPVSLVCVTPDRSPSQLSSYSESVGLEGALFAKDTANTRNISLNNIYQFGMMHNGKMLRSGLHTPTSLKNLVTKMEPTYRYDVGELENPLAKELWWMVERGHPEGMKTLVKAAKRSAIKEDAQKILDIVDGQFQSKAQELMAAPASMDTYEEIEELLTEGKGLDLKDLAKHYKDMGRSKEMKDEIKAKTAFMKIVNALERSGIEKKRAQAKGAFAQLAEALPDTKYGQLAAKK